MKLLVLAQIPPPVHGQSIMVQAAVEGLPAHGIELEHVDLSLSRNAAGIGRWQAGKLSKILDACFHAIVARFTSSCDVLYYVPAPGKRGALYRDWLVMLLCRPFFKKLVLHWHAAGLGEWLETHATAPERWLTKLLLGRADLAIVLGERLRRDAEILAARKIAVVRNGIADPCPGFSRSERGEGAASPEGTGQIDQVGAGAPPPRILAKHSSIKTAVFLGLCIPEKGVLDAIEAVRLANENSSTGRWRLVLAGDIPDKAFATKIAQLVTSSQGQVEYAGFVLDDAKHHLLSTAHALVFPTYYAAETQGLVVAEALAYDLPPVVTDWRAVAENLPKQHAHVVAPRAPGEIARALAEIAHAPPPRGKSRQHFLEHYALPRHLAALAAQLGNL
jgi:glycosyltransferase involved in cell wall biosynthesis